MGVAGLGWFFLGNGRERFDKWRFAGDGSGAGRGLLNTRPIGAPAAGGLSASGSSYGGMASASGSGSGL